MVPINDTSRIFNSITFALLTNKYWHYCSIVVPLTVVAFRGVTAQWFFTRNVGNARPIYHVAWKVE